MRNEFVLLSLAHEPVSAREYNISDLARVFGVSLRTLRFYEDKGLLQPRRHGTTRYYTARDRTRLELVLKGKRLGFSLAEIRRLIASRSSIGSDSADLTVSLGRDQIAAQIAHLEQQRQRLDVALEELRCALTKTIEETADTASIQQPL